jgi:hypothetical protein
MVGTLWHEFGGMGKRGPNPVDLGKLSLLEFEFYKAFHMLRDGVPLPPKYAPPMGLTPQEIREFLPQLKAMSPQQFWLTTKKTAAELDKPLNLQRRPTPTELKWAEQERDGEVQGLERQLRLPSIDARAARRKIWAELVRADSYSALRKVCGRWARLPDVRRRGMTSFPMHVVENAAQFLSMKQNKRFPRSDYGDDSRLEYLARGMAGVLCGVKAMTGIERLRNMKHDPSGPLWTTCQGNYILPEREQYCRCWQCSIHRTNRVSKKTQTWYENGLRVFMELAATVKAPKEWSRIRIGY